MLVRQMSDSCQTTSLILRDIRLIFATKTSNDETDFSIFDNSSMGIFWFIYLCFRNNERKQK